MAAKPQLANCLCIFCLWGGSSMHIICFSPINLSSVNLIITPAKESRMEEKNPFLPQQWGDELLAQGREGKEEGRKDWDEKEGKEKRKRCQQLNQHYSLISKSALFYYSSSQALLEQIRVLSHFSHVWLFVTPWTVAHQAPLSMGFSRQEYWSELPFPS